MGRRGSRKEEITHGWLKKENNNDKKAWTGMLKRDNNQFSITEGKYTESALKECKCPMLFQFLLLNSSGVCIIQYRVFSATNMILSNNIVQVIFYTHTNSGFSQL